MPRKLRQQQIPAVNQSKGRKALSTSGKYFILSYLAK